ncbi:hypothetical protein H6P81_015695 [Aristolochia fimbriata]|uniref:RING-type E3 ubiquitin transferase n=1 Tax=Aristolochia fimbriata TaxID=158543 RepID=A0AAV7E8D0_ARIFI|nr:hypothetical protein H6P81_015695 [Aristolochia fimbriata]
MSSDRPSYSCNLESTPSAVDDHKVTLIVRIQEKFEVEVVSRDQEPNAEEISRPSLSGSRSVASSFDLNELFPPMSTAVLPMMVATTLYEAAVKSEESLEELELQITSFIISKLREHETTTQYGFTLIANVEEWWRIRIRDDDQQGRSSLMASLVEQEIHTQRDSKESCSICLSDFSVGKEIGRTPCGHIFHPDCIRKWFNRSTSCPLCRFAITE